MKKIGILILISLFAFQINAQVKSSLTIFSKEGEKFWIVRNGIKQNEKPATSVTIDNIVDRSFKIKVLIDDDKLTTVDQSIYTIDVDEQICNLTYELRKKDKGKYVLRTVSYVPVSEVTTTPPQQTTNQSQQTQTNTTQPQQNQSTTINANGVNMTVTDSNTGVDFNVNMNVPTNSKTITTTTQHSSTTSTISSGYMKNGSMCQTSSMSPKAYLDFKYDIEAKNMYNRLEYIKSIFRKNCMLAEQVAGIIKLNYPTVDELEVAKFGYRYTWDTENYGLVVKAIKSESKQKELIGFLNVGSSNTTTTTTSSSTPQQTTSTSAYQIKQHTGGQTTQPANGNINCRGAMPTADFEEAKAQMNKVSFAADKMKVAKQVVQANCLSVAQIKEFCKLFSFENDKLEYAKFAYDFTFEKNKYYLVNDVFSFSSSRDELDEFIQSKQK